MLTFFIFNEKYEGHLEIFLGLLSRSIAYSNDYKFANLLKGSFYYQKHFIGGRIEKALAVLYELERNNVLILMQCTVLMLEPTAFQKTYIPLTLVEEDVTGMDLNIILLEHDSYRLTCLHEAAFHGNTEAIEEMLKNISQNLNDPEHKNVADQVINEVMAWDEYGFTPFYVAAACGHKEIYHKMLAFLKQVIPDDTLGKHLIDIQGFVHRALSDAINSENLQMFQLILEGLKKELGQKELLQILRLPRFDFPSGIFSFFEESKTKELFNAMAKIVVMRDDNVQDYTDLYDLVFHNHETPSSLQYIDFENLQGLLLLKGVDDFTEKICNNKSGFFNGYSLLSNHLLKQFKKDQLEEFVETITSSNKCKQMESSTILKQDQLLPRNSYWGDFLLYNIASGISDNRIILSFFDCFKHLSASYLKKLLLHEDDKGPIVIQLPLDVVEGMLTYLSDQSQEEVKQQWKNNAPPMDIFFASNIIDSFKQKYRLFSDTCYFINILRHYLNYGSEFHLKEFVNIVTSVRNIGEERKSVWSNVFRWCYKEEKIQEILKLVSEKVDILGRDAVKTMLLHQIDEMPSLFKAVLWGWDIDAQLEILPYEIKEEIQQFMKINAPELIDRVFEDPTTHFNPLFLLNYRSALNTLTYLLDYSEYNQLQQFVHLITTVHFVFPSIKFTPINVDGSGESMPQSETFFSIWAELFTNDCKDHRTDDIAKMDKFMKRFSEQLGTNAVKELVLHKDDKRPVIFDRALNGEEKLLETMLKYLSAEDRKEVQHQVDKFLEERFKIAGDGDWINKYYLHQEK
jgi:RNAse (barnase) inhibitor barstar